MAASPKWKVYTEDGEYIASVKRPQFGAMILAGLGQPQSTIRIGHRYIMWTESVDGDSAESYDVVAQTCTERYRIFLHAHTQETK